MERLLHLGKRGRMCVNECAFECMRIINFMSFFLYANNLFRTMCQDLLYKKNKTGDLIQLLFYLLLNKSVYIFIMFSFFA